ncbi:unnamed protein product [Sphagnum balticum]
MVNFKFSNKHMYNLLLSCFFLIAGAISYVEAAVQYYDWTVAYTYASPDCVEKLVMAVNGEVPGPRIDATEGDTIVVNLTNHLPTEGVVIHWHGMHQVGTPYYDGTASVSQCTINFGETFTYSFIVDRAGTYFWHGHFGMQRTAGLYGSIIVQLPDSQKEPFDYDDEASVLLSDWWHKSIYEQQLGLDSIPFRFVGEPQSLLIEGRGKYNCALDPGSNGASPSCLPCNASNPECAYHVIPVEHGKTYRLRIASITSLSSLNFVLEGHNLTVVTIDGRYIEPVVVENLDIYSGQSYSVLFTADQDQSRNYWAGINVRGRVPNTTTGLAVLQYLPNSTDLQLPPSKPPGSPAWDDFDYSLAQARLYKVKPGYEKPVPQSAGRTLILLNTQNKINGHIKWAINNVSFVFPPTPFLAAFKLKLKNAFSPIAPPDLPPNKPDFNIFALPNPNDPSEINANFGSSPYVFKLGEIVDVIVQNANTLNPNNSEIHPWHLHGHDFWILGYGKGKFDPQNDPQSFNLADPPLRNTVAVFPYGWVAIRFVANNPGVWPFHCHIESHFYMGMGVIFAEGIHKLPSLPTETLGCGLTKPRH